MSSKQRGGFTLVEILIVVVILGILAAIVIPQFTNASESAKGSSLISQLQTIRSQLELAQIQHQGTYPALPTTDGAEWTNLQTETDPTSTTAGVYTTSDDDGDEVGPYLQSPPVNPFENSSSVATAAAAGVGWVYDQATGEITACMASAKATELGLDTTNDITTY